MSVEALVQSIFEGQEDKAIQQVETDPALVNAEVEVNMPGHSGDKPFTPLTAAADQNLARLARTLICHGADITSTHGPNGGTALHLAAWQGQSEIVELLVGHNAPLEARCKDFHGTSLDWAIHGSTDDAWCTKRDQVGAARLLFRAGAYFDPNSLEAFEIPDEMAGLIEESMRLIPQYWEAVQGDDLRALRILLEQHPDLVHQRIKGESWAPGRIHDPDAKGQVPAPQDYPFTNTAVHFAAVNSKVELMKLLIEFGADLNAVGYEANKGLTPPIVLAAWEGSLETMRLLLEAGADPNLPASAENALYCAAEHKAPAKAALLEAFGARHDVFTAALTGRTWFVERELRAYEPLAERRSLKRHRTPDEEATYGQKERP